MVHMGKWNGEEKEICRAERYIMKGENISFVKAKRIGRTESRCGRRSVNADGERTERIGCRRIRLADAKTHGGLCCQQQKKMKTCKFL